MNKATTAKLAAALTMFAVAFVLFIKLSPARQSRDESAYFYDLQEQKLFVASRSSIPPIPGIKKKELTAVRAVVVSASGDPGDKASRRIVYLEKYAPELKQVLEARRAGKTDIVPSHQERQALIFVKRLADTQWYPVSSPEGEKIMSEWSVPGPDGKVPVVCSP